MKILLYGINHSPELTGIGKYTGELAAWLAARGHEVRVVTAPPYYPEWRVHEGFRSAYFSREERDGVQVWRCPLWVPAKPRGTTRLLHLASFAASSFPVMLRQVFWRADVVWVVEPSLFCAPTALLVSKLSGSKSWLHIQDFEIDAAFELGILGQGWGRNWALRIESALMRRFDVVSTISLRMLERLGTKGVGGGALFPNWVDTEEIYPLGRPSVLREKLGIGSEDVVALYSGNMGGKQGLEILSDVVRVCASSGNAKNKLRFVFCGRGPGRAAIEGSCSGFSNVMFLDLVPSEQLNDLLNLADIHLLPQRGDVADLVMPSKLNGMMASGRPVLATAAPGTQVATVLLGRGISVLPGDAEGMSAALLALAQDGDLRIRLGVAARRYAVDALGKEAILQSFERQLRDL